MCKNTISTLDQATTELIAAVVAAAQVNAAAVKLPCFFPTHPEHWFTQAEAQFAFKGVILDSTKYYCVVSSFDSIVQECMALILGKYDYLKATF